MKHAIYAMALSLVVAAFGGRLGAEGGVVEKGKALVEKKRCILCHKEGGKGQPMAALAGANTDTYLKESILHPKETIGPKTLMPTYKFTDQEVQAVIEYLRSMSQL